MDDFDKYLNKQLKNPEFKKEWDKSEQEYHKVILEQKHKIIETMKPNA